MLCSRLHNCWEIENIISIKYIRKLKLTVSGSLARQSTAHIYPLPQKIRATADIYTVSTYFAYINHSRLFHAYKCYFLKIYIRLDSHGILTVVFFSCYHYPGNSHWLHLSQQKESLRRAHPSNG